MLSNGFGGFFRLFYTKNVLRKIFPEGSLIQILLRKVMRPDRPRKA